MVALKSDEIGMSRKFPQSPETVGETLVRPAKLKAARYINPKLHDFRPKRSTHLPGAKEPLTLYLHSLRPRSSVTLHRRRAAPLCGTIARDELDAAPALGDLPIALPAPPAGASRALEIAASVRAR